MSAVAEEQSPEPKMTDGGAARQTEELKSKFLQAFPPFAGRDFQLYFVGQLVSMIGTWAEIVAQGWLVFEITGSAFWVGVTAAASSLPVGSRKNIYL